MRLRSKDMDKVVKTKAGRWSNPSVRLLAGQEDPLEIMLRRARETVLGAMDKGWSGPPFDPIALSGILGIPVVPRADIRDARTVPQGDAGVCIEYNPTRPRGRLRYSVAHEIAHTLFPDCDEQIRNRSARHEMKGDEWQLEMLCNILLVNRHTASAAEMIVAFARENKLAAIIGEKTAGRLLSATSVNVGNGFRLALPTGAYHTWKGAVLEGTPIEPGKSVQFDWRERRRRRDVQL
jgi:hypothetical protein